MVSNGQPKTEKNPRGAGRPRVELDLDVIKRLALIQCTVPEIAAVLHVPESTLKTRPDVMALIDEVREKGKTSLRRLQWDAALKGNCTMQIWLGKQYLGQSDKVEQGVNVNVKVRAEDLGDDDLAAIIAGRGSKRIAAPAVGPLSSN